ncbi:hypothetical protein DSL99_550 [Leeuwenhoekiella marinoflava]|uniref:Uncharacterized protein n=1 Tax=Leeuwenhoekiella marinoflava TaxID=988 RepID=A0A4Q0PQE1_9FLAO|nr:hypothetical protein DSL99_550 [Leeuwenhoekiella marinoflava]
MLTHRGFFSVLSTKDTFGYSTFKDPEMNSG